MERRGLTCPRTDPAPTGDTQKRKHTGFSKTIAKAHNDGMSEAGQAQRHKVTGTSQRGAWFFRRGRKKNTLLGHHFPCAKQQHVQQTTAHAQTDTAIIVSSPLQASALHGSDPTRTVASDTTAHAASRRIGGIACLLLPTHGGLDRVEATRRATAGCYNARQSRGCRIRRRASTARCSV